MYIVKARWTPSQYFIYISVYLLPVFAADPEELCVRERPACPSSEPETRDALLQRAQAAEERARRSEEALARAMEDLHKLRSVEFLYFMFVLYALISIMLMHLS